MASIKVKYRPSSVAGKEGTIYYQIIIDRTVRRLHTGYHVLASEWDPARDTVIPKGAGERRANILYIRERIRHDLERLNRLARRLDAVAPGFTPADLIDEFRRHQKEYTLCNYMQALIIRHKQNGKTRTAETYTAALHSFQKFLAVQTAGTGCRYDDDLMLECLTAEIMEAYQAWHRRQGNSPNTISFYTRILRAVYNRAVDEEIIENRHPFRRVYTGIGKTVKRALLLPVIKKIKELDLTRDPALDYARDMFLLSFYLRGMSFIDMSYLRKADLRNGSVKYRRRKTGQQLVIAWTHEMQTIIDKYPANPTQYLLPIIKTVGCNERCAYRNAAYNINYHLKKIAHIIGVDMPITMYVARHSWASAAKAKGIPLSVISQGMGHDSETTTQIYLASLDTSVVDKANSLILRSI